MTTPDSATVYKKTEAGTKAIASRNAALSPRLRHLLILINGFETAGSLLQKLAVPNFESTMFDQLVALGFVEAGHGKVMSSHAAALHDSLEPARFLKAKAYILDVTRSLLSDDSHPIVKSVKSAEDEAALVVCVDACRKLIVTLSDRATADNFAAKVRSILD